jgi:Domain of unknown function DUF11
MLHRMIGGVLAGVLLIGTSLASAPVVAAEGGFDLAVSMTGPTRVMSTRDYSFTVTVTNLGPETASNTVVGAGMGDWFNAVSFVCNDANGDRGVGGCAMAPLASGRSMTATMTVNVCCLVRHEDRHAWVAAGIGPVDGDYEGWNEINVDNDWVQYDVFIIGKRVR